MAGSIRDHARAPWQISPTTSLARYLQDQQKAYDEQAAGLRLDLTRGKPAADQLDLSDALLRLPTSTRDRSGTDVRNYGGLAGLGELREIFAELLGTDPSQVIVGVPRPDHDAHDDRRLPAPRRRRVPSSLVEGGAGHRSSARSPATTVILSRRVLRHRHGHRRDARRRPDMAAVEALVKDDPTVKGIWIVPTYSNPTGAVVSQEIAARLAAAPAAAPDFTIFWDNAYAFHHLTEDEAKTADIPSLAAASGHPNRPIVFASTSKISATPAPASPCSPRVRRTSPGT